MASDIAPISGDGILAVGSIFRSWKLVSVLAEGGTSRVFLARHIVLQGQSAAVKVMNVGRGEDPERVRRFHEEAQIHFSLRNANVPEFYDAAIVDDKAVVVLEHLDGFDLADGIRKLERLSPGDALFVAHKVLQALAAMHRWGVHRDIKPANVFICREPVRDEDGFVRKARVRLLDFGFAKLFHRTRFTREGAKPGTLGYMSPEQHRGLDAEPRSDVYGLGLVLFEMLAGHQLFVPNPASPPSPVELRRAHLEAPLDLVHDLPLAPPEVRAFVARLLAKDPSDRPTAREAAGEAERLALAHAATARLFHDDATDPLEVLQRLVSERVKETLAGVAAMGAVDLESTNLTGIDVSRYARAVIAQMALDDAKSAREASAAPDAPVTNVSLGSTGPSSASPHADASTPTIRDGADAAPLTTLREPPTPSVAAATLRTPPVDVSIHAAPEPAREPVVIPEASYGTAPVAVPRSAGEFDLRNVECVRKLLGRPRFFARPALQRDDGAVFELRESTRLGSKPTSAIRAAGDSGEAFEILARVRTGGLLELAPADDENDLAAIEIEGVATTGRTPLRHGDLVQAGRTRFRAIDLEVRDPGEPEGSSRRRLAPALIAAIGPGSTTPRVHALASNLTLVGASTACELVVHGIPDVAFGVWMRGDATLEIVALATSRLPYGDAFVAIHRVDDLGAFDLGEGRTLVADNGARVRQAAAARWAERAPGAHRAHWRR